ncbi:MAG: ferrous iron transport protein B [Saprospiraceae bacterium]
MKAFETLPRIALVGNPNSGKSSLFNLLTGLRQNVANLPGVTVDVKKGTAIWDDKKYQIIDLPGMYSVFPNSADERIPIDILTNPNHHLHPDLVVYVIDSTQIERHLLLATQIIDMGFKAIIALNMIDLADDRGMFIDTQAIEHYLHCPVIKISSRELQGIDQLKSTIDRRIETEYSVIQKSIYTLTEIEKCVANKLDSEQNNSIYFKKILAHHYKWLSFIREDEKKEIEKVNLQCGFNDIQLQVHETMERYNAFLPIVKSAVKYKKDPSQSITDTIDKVITHRILGPIIFFSIMLLVFQAVYAWASVPMDLIESGFALFGDTLTKYLPTNWISDLLVNGVLAGLSGVLVFIPQIAILFLLIAILEESGYMSRVVFMFDGIMQKFGMNGRSIISLISSGACAIPAIMATRTINNPKERLITILASPLISCSARLPVYAVLVGFVVPNSINYGPFNAQGLVFSGLYFLGILGALFFAFVLKLFIKTEGQSYLMMELPEYKKPLFKNIYTDVFEKVKSFLIGAGKIIMIISMVLWVGASFGPSKGMENARINAQKLSTLHQYSVKQSQQLEKSMLIEASYIGVIGKWIEPAIKPLGYDWKIGIALLTSFAAREVFVGTMATLYSLDSGTSEQTLRQKMNSELKPNGEKRYDPATSLSLLIFYVFALQCMSTLAIVRKETGTWKWPIFQFFAMGAMAYFGALMVYQLMS